MDTVDPSLSDTSSLTLQGSRDPDSLQVSATNSNLSERGIRSGPVTATSPHALYGDITISAVALPEPNDIIQNPAATESVQSFHSAVSHHNGPGEIATTPQSNLPMETTHRQQYFTVTEMTPQKKWRAGTSWLSPISKSLGSRPKPGPIRYLLLVVLGTT